jgi:hypothetical protein
MCKEKIENHNWMIVLQNWLKEEKLSISDILKLGYHDVSILASKLKTKGLIFWSQTMRYISQAMEIWE